MIVLIETRMVRNLYFNSFLELRVYKSKDVFSSWPVIAVYELNLTILPIYTFCLIISFYFGVFHDFEDIFELIHNTHRIISFWDIACQSKNFDFLQSFWSNVNCFIFLLSLWCSVNEIIDVLYFHVIIIYLFELKGFRTRIAFVIDKRVVSILYPKSGVCCKSVILLIYHLYRCLPLWFLSF